MPGKSWDKSPHFPGRRCDAAQRRRYFELVYGLVRALGGTVNVERAIGVPKGTLYKRASGKLPLRYEALLAMECLAARVETAPLAVVTQFADFLKGELHAG